MNIKVKSSTKEQQRIDVLQPYTREGKLNDKYVKFYGKPKSLSEVKKEVGSKVDIDWDRINNKTTSKIYYT
jgi:hypothetical protein